MMNLFTSNNNALCKSSGKKRFRDRKEAKRVVIYARRAKAQAERDGIISKRQEDRTYRCDDCGGWHVTSKPVSMT